jgi:hypothetical protein
MIKSTKYFFFIISLLLSYHSQAAIKWNDEETQIFIYNINQAISREPKIFLDPEHDPLVFQDKEGESAVKFVLNSAARVEDWRNMSCTKGCENIFSILGIAFFEGYMEGKPNLLEASKWLVRGFLIGGESGLWAGRAETFLKTWIDDLGLDDMTTSSSDEEIEAAIKAVHAKLSSESEEETGE